MGACTLGEALMVVLIAAILLHLAVVGALWWWLNKPMGKER